MADFLMHDFICLHHGAGLPVATFLLRDHYAEYGAGSFRKAKLKTQCYHKLQTQEV
jgi:hypothetical protein